MSLKKIWVLPDPSDPTNIDASIKKYTGDFAKYQKPAYLIDADQFMVDIKQAIMTGPLNELEYRLNVTFLKHLGERSEK